MIFKIQLNTSRFALCFIIALAGILGSTQAVAIKVLSYNICWECMTNSSRGTAGPLGSRCDWMAQQTGSQSLKVTKCASNIAKTIDAASDLFGGARVGYDFVGLQEAAGWQDLQKMARTLKNMRATSFVLGLDHFVTFYAPTYRLIKKIQGGFERYSRPYQILVFQNGIIFVNLHAPHGWRISNMEDKLSAALKSNTTLQERNIYKKYRIIIAGDFNDDKPAGEGRYYPAQLSNRPFAPFSKAGIPTKVYLNAKPPITCCSTRLPHRPGYFKGDYIFDSIYIKDRVTLGVPSNYDYQTPKSDHLPVIYNAPK